MNSVTPIPGSYNTMASSASTITDQLPPIPNLTLHGLGNNAHDSNFYGFGNNNNAQDNGNSNYSLVLDDYYLFMQSDIHQDIVKDFISRLWTHDSPFTIVLIFLYTSMFVVGFVGNGMVIIVMLKYKHMRSVTNLFFLNLSVGDILVVLICMPFSLAPYVYKVSAWGLEIRSLTIING